jgi:hypothetical protein
MTANKANALGQKKAPLRTAFTAGDLRRYNLRRIYEYESK